MKTRTGFVSNSSSSSFIVDRNLIKNIPKDFCVSDCDGETTWCYFEITNRLDKDMKEWDNQNNQQDILNKTIYCCLSSLLYDLEQKIEVECLGKNSSLSYNWIDPDSGVTKEYDELEWFDKQNVGNLCLTIDEVNEYTKQYVKKYKKKRETSNSNYIYIDTRDWMIVSRIFERWKKVFKIKDVVVLEYADETSDGCMMEHYVMPQLSTMSDIVSISQH